MIDPLDKLVIMSRDEKYAGMMIRFCRRFGDGWEVTEAWDLDADGCPMVRVPGSEQRYYIAKKRMTNEQFKRLFGERKIE